MSHTQDRVMITPAISLYMFEGDTQVFVKQNNFKVLNSTCVKVTADTNRSQEELLGRCQGTSQKAEMGIFNEDAFCRIFGTVLKNSLNDSFTEHLGLPVFLARCILFTGLSLIPNCTSPLIRALIFDSPDWQLQWRDTGGTVSN